MPLGTSLVADTGASAIGNGQHAELSAAQISTKYGAGNVKTSSVDYTFTFKGQHIYFRKGVPVVITDAAMLAALTAAGAPVS
jgi:hypothetical protein